MLLRKKVVLLLEKILLFPETSISIITIIAILVGYSQLPVLLIQSTCCSSVISQSLEEKVESNPW